MYSESDDATLSSKKLAQICLDNVVAECGSQDRGLLKGDSIYIIRNSKVPVALIEVGFMTNHEELDKLNSTKYQKKAAQGIYNAIMEAFQEGY
jgi:N-acetylmuramoyl-L-alanine amidase